MEVTKINPDDFDAHDLAPAVEILHQGGVIAYPTETVYGLGANITHRKAVARIYQIKKRDPQKPISIMTASVAGALELTDDVSELGKILMKRYWPGPLTLILKASQKLPKDLVSRDQKIGLRVPDHPLTQALVQLHKDPITSTSANITGCAPATHAEEVVRQLGESIDLVIDGGESSAKRASTVVDVTGEAPVVLREGVISLSEIEQSLQGASYEF